MNQELSTGYKVVIAILVIALLIAVWGWWSAGKDDSLADVYEGVAAFQADIAAACVDTTSEAGRDTCSDALEEFEEALEEYRNVIKDVQEASTTTPSST